MTRRRLAECASIVVLTSALALVAQGAGWVSAIITTPTAVLVSATLLALTTPTVANAFDVSRRAARAAAALDEERHERLCDLQRAAMHDDLTGLLGRRGLLEPLNRAASAAGPGALTAVLFIDLDGFKPVNDLHGHAAGDELLKVLAARLQNSAREADAVARTGGDEFVLVLTGLPDVKAPVRIVERVRAEVFREVVLPDGAKVSVGASIGLATTEQPCAGDDLLSAADAAMYLEKHADHLPSRRERRLTPPLPYAAAVDSPASCDTRVNS